MKQIIWRVDREEHKVFVFGVGLVGGSIVRHLTSKSTSGVVDYEWSWLSQNQRKEQTQRLIDQHNEPRPSSANRTVSVLWAAGAAGFSSSDETLRQEFSAFTDVCDLALSFADLRSTHKVRLHVISSAGGLFEGQRMVAEHTKPLPHRPYGHSKLQQERFIAALPSHIEKFIYRPSSVFGYNPGARTGLITALVRNATLRRVTRIFGSMTTLRDFVYVEDIARFIADAIWHPQDPTPFNLVSGKATALGEVVEVIRNIVGTNLLLEIDPSPSNASDNTFSPKILPAGFSNSDFRTAVRETARKLKQNELLSR